MKPIVLFVVSATASSAAIASDFSQLSEPPFARMMLISPRRAMEAQCGALARADARLDRNMQAADAEAIAAEILKPLVIEIGDARQAGFLVEGERLGPKEYDDAEAAKQRIVVMDMIEKHCAPLFDAYRSGGASALQAELEPARGLIPLLPLADCVAIAEASVRSNEQSPFDKDALVELNSLARQGGTEQEIVDRERAIAAARARLAAQPEDKDYMTRAVACLATFRKHAEGLRGTSGN